MGQELLYGAGVAILLAALIWGVLKAGRLSKREKRSGDEAAQKRYERDDG